MSTPRRKHTTVGLALVALLTLVPATGASADDEVVSGTRLLSSSASTSGAKGPRRLNDIAGVIHLRVPAGTGAEGIVIDQTTLAILAESGIISTGSETAAELQPGPEPEPTGVQLVPTAEQRWRDRYEEQQKKIRDMEAGLADFEKGVIDNRSPHASSQPHNLPPGVRNPNQITRETTEQEIAAEQARLQSMRQQARREGVDLRRQRR